MRFVKAIVFAVLIVAIGMMFVVQTRRTTNERIAIARAAAGVPEGDVGGEVAGSSNAAALSDFGMELSQRELLRIQFADLLGRFAVILVPLVFVVCLGGAAIMGKSTKRDAAGPSTTRE